MALCEESNTRGKVKEYYGKTLQKTQDLQTSACSFAVGKLDKHVGDAMKLVHPEIASKSYGCGLAVPECLEGIKILDLGSGGGQDCFALSKLVGEEGFVTGVDMTDEMLAMANKYIEYHTGVFGYPKPNVKFVKGYVENLRDAGIEDNSVDIIISNCVINLCHDKKSVLQEAFRVLKDGGELYFSDMYADRDVIDDIKNNEVAWGEGLGGALRWERLYSIAKEIGFEVPRTVSSSIIEVTNPEMKQLVGNTRYAAVGYRLFKISSNATREQTYVKYKGGVTGHENEFQLDLCYKFRRDVVKTVDGDTAIILQHSRFKDKFEILGAADGSNHPKVEKIDPFALASS